MLLFHYLPHYLKNYSAVSVSEATQAPHCIGSMMACSHSNMRADALPVAVGISSPYLPLLPLSLQECLHCLYSLLPFLTTAFSAFKLYSKLAVAARLWRAATAMAHRKN